MDKRKFKEKKEKPRTRIIDLSDYRKNKVEERRREYERILFHRILGVYSFAENSGLHHVEIVDISYSGIRFREVRPEAALQVDQRLPVRFYFTPTSFVRVFVQVKRVNPFKDEDKDGLEYGCTLDQDTKSYTVIQELIQFMHKYAEVASYDNHPPMIWF